MEINKNSNIFLSQNNDEILNINSQNNTNTNSLELLQISKNDDTLDFKTMNDKIFGVAYKKKKQKKYKKIEKYFDFSKSTKYDFIVFFKVNEKYDTLKKDETNINFCIQNFNISLKNFLMRKINQIEQEIFNVDKILSNSIYVIEFSSILPDFSMKKKDKFAIILINLDIKEIHIEYTSVLLNNLARKIFKSEKMLLNKLSVGDGKEKLEIDEINKKNYSDNYTKPNFDGD